jgi:dipeptidyl aminopeptidase/acylaminoacyl peptidase
MTTFERFEGEIPRLMGELAPARPPDYIDDLLRRTEATGQRPSWSDLERWLPMGVIARTSNAPRIPWRSLAIVAAVLLLAAAGLFYAGSRAPSLPAPFGPARNGLLVFSTTQGDIVAADATTGQDSILIGGPTLDSDPEFSHDGTRFAFDRRDAPGDARRALYLADADGGNVHQLMAPAPLIRWFEWSPDGDSIYLVRDGDPPQEITIVDTVDGSTTRLDVGFDVATFTRRPGSDDLIVSGDGGFFLVGLDGTPPRLIMRDPIALYDQFAVSPDGSTLVYPSWTSGAEGRIHVVDIDRGMDRGIDFAPGYVYTDLSPTVSPDGTKILVHRSDADGYRLTLLPVDGHGPAISMGEHHPDMTNGARTGFSPDGRTVIATYQDDGTTWLYDTSTGEGRQRTWPIPRETRPSWQRLAR